MKEFKEIFKKQLKYSKPLTKDTLKNFKGTNAQEGDIVVYILKRYKNKQACYVSIFEREWKEFSKKNIFVKYVQYSDTLPEFHEI